MITTNQKTLDIFTTVKTEQILEDTVEFDGLGPSAPVTTLLGPSAIKLLHATIGGFNGTLDWYVP